MEQARVRSLFNGIAHRYDLLNRLLSAGVDARWRRRAVRHLQGPDQVRVLDVATGTADLAIAAIGAGAREVVGVDIAGRMLDLGRRKVLERGLASRITLTEGAAERLEFPDGSFDAAIVAFGVRNFERLDAGLGEMFRVLRPGGRIVVLEFSKPDRAPFRQVYFLYFRRILPLIGRLVSGHNDAYTYLPDTVMRFPEGEGFMAHLRTAGFDGVSQERLTFGIASIYTGIRPPTGEAAPPR
jgi:demethylmenaquinone methyltransferase/2-methoxy-6-polyprenyl-1,4-benzoquinol methylase